MQKANDILNRAQHEDSDYRPPLLLCVGDVSSVVLGFPGGGLDGPDGLTEPQFEFESDDDCQ